MPFLSNSRRNFIKQISIAGAAALSSEPILAVNNSIQKKQSQLNFLFQGDSITDGNRGRNADPNHIMGHGYAFSIASRAGATFPEKQNSFYNRGISGNKVTDLAARWQNDTLNLKPDVLSILVGINDSSSVVNNYPNNVTVTQYEKVYRELINQTKNALPECLLVLCEPFILPVGKVKDNWAAYNDDVKQRQQVVSKLAKEFNAVFVPLQTIFDKEHNSARVADEYWIWDGVHPSYSGHELITKEWLKQVGKRLPFLKKL
jgi:lysophospholipase L1-like esterase